VTIEEARRKTAQHAPVACCQVEANLDLQKFSAERLEFRCKECGRVHRRMAGAMPGLINVAGVPLGH
jgi:hypothetical protein